MENLGKAIRLRTENDEIKNKITTLVNSRTECYGALRVQNQSKEYYLEQRDRIQNFNSRIKSLEVRTIVNKHNIDHFLSLGLLQEIDAIGGSYSDLHGLFKVDGTPKKSSKIEGLRLVQTFSHEFEIKKWIPDLSKCAVVTFFSKHQDGVYTSAIKLEVTRGDVASIIKKEELIQKKLQLLEDEVSKIRFGYTEGMKECTYKIMRLEGGIFKF